MKKPVFTFGLLASSLVMLAAIPLLNNNNSFLSNTAMAQGYDNYGNSYYSSYPTDSSYPTVDKKYECRTGPFEGFFVSSPEFCKHVKFDDDRKDRDNKTGPGPGTDPTSIVFLNFDTWNLSQWIKGPITPTSQNICIEHDYPGQNNRLEVVSSPVKQGPHALEVTLTENATVIPGTGVNGERAELKYCDSPNHVHLFTNGEDVWYHWYTQFSATDFTIPTPINNGNWHVWTQWHGLTETLYDVPVAFNLNGNQLNLRVLGAVNDNQNCFTIQSGQCGYLWVEPIEQGKWYEILLHVKWSTSSDGFVEGWVQKDGGTQIPFVKYQGVTLNPAGSDGVYLKQGLYRNPAINETQTLWHDGMVVAKCPTNTEFNPSTNKCDTI